MTSPDRSPLERLADGLPGAAVGVTLTGDRITVAGAPGMAVPQKPADWLRHEAPTVWPNTPHGEARPTLLFGILRDSGTSAGKRPLDGVLRDALEERLPGDSPEQQQVLATAMKSKFWTTAGSGKAKDDGKRYLLPLHARLPLSFGQEKAKGGKTEFGYKMFRGTVLPFLLSGTSGTVDTDLLERFLAEFRSEEDLTELDRAVLKIAADIAPDTTGPDASMLLSRSKDVLGRLQDAKGGFCGPSLDQFRLDLEQVLTMDLPRRDRIHQITLLLALHLTTRLYRASIVLSKRLDGCIALFPSGGIGGLPESGCAVRCCGQPTGCDLAGRIRFRVGSGAFRSVKLTEPCVASYRDMTSNYLLPLPVTISCANFAKEALAAAGGPALASADLEGLRSALEGDSTLRARFDAVAQLLAVCRLYQLRGNSLANREEFQDSGLPGLHRLRMTLLESRRTTMRKEGRDVVHQLAKEVRSGRLIGNNGNAAVFFELDEDMLHLLVRLVCGDRLISYGDFLKGLLRYGIAPQDTAEEQLLQSGLARLGMLERYADSDESAYVSYPDTNDDEDDEDA